jgi:hypothetical protein
VRWQAPIEQRWGANSLEGSGATPLFIACVTGKLPCVMLLSSYGAKRRVPVPALDRLVSAEEVARGTHAQAPTLNVPRWRGPGVLAGWRGPGTLAGWRGPGMAGWRYPRWVGARC